MDWQAAHERMKNASDAWEAARSAWRVANIAMHMNRNPETEAAHQAAYDAVLSTHVEIEAAYAVVRTFLHA